MEWPYASDIAKSEYDGTINLFPKAFPWLFPGGVGDVLAYKNIPMEADVWAETLLYYYDGRFAKDTFWTFYALNYVERKRNQKRGSFFVNSFSNEKEKPLEEIIKEIRKGHTTWLDKITYFSAGVKGSSQYWRARRNEVYTWISHHVDMGHGPPNFFITFSCAEYWWDDIRRLIQDRLKCAGLEPPAFTELTKVRIINEYTLVVQEYFQKRVQEWMETVGKKVFKIKHYWGRFEFAPSRGQIHLHLLAIADFLQFFSKLSTEHDKDKRAEQLAKWAKNVLQYDCDFKQVDDIVEHPSIVRYSDIGASEKKKDLYELKAKCQYHRCSGYCMRKRKVTSKGETAQSKKRKVCRFGAGVETTPGACDTPGFRLRDTPAIVRDIRGFDRLETPRSDRRVTQTSAYMIQSWRANCDIQIFLYDTDPRHPNLDEIASVTDYIVSYACKGNETATAVAKQLKQYVLDMDNDTAETTSTTKLSRIILNQTLKSKMVSKQEATVQLGNLKLWICSDTIERVSLSNGYKLTNSKSSNNASSIISRYARRMKTCPGPLQETYKKMSLDDYFHLLKNTKSSKSANFIIPHYVGAKCAPTYPVTPEYAR